MKGLLLFVVFGAGCQGAVDRTPPMRDVGLPPVPAVPAELLQDKQATTLHLSPDDPALTAPEGCEGGWTKVDAGPALPWVGRWKCQQKISPKELGLWRPVPDLPDGIYARDGLEWVETWSQEKTDWQLLRSVGPSHGEP